MIFWQSLQRRLGPAKNQGFLLYASVSILGVLAFGVAENQKDSLILDLMPVRKDRRTPSPVVGVRWSWSPLESRCLCGDMKEQLWGVFV